MAGPDPVPLIPTPDWLGALAAPIDFGGIARAAAAAAAAAVEAAKQALADAQKFQEMKDILKDSPTGAAALKYLEDHNVTTEFANGGGSFWDGTKIVIDRNESAEEAALTLVHEVNHTRSDLENTGADIDNDTRADYVQKMLDEEVKGTVDSIKAKNELVEAGSTISATFPLEAEYNTAYKDAVDDLVAANPAATAAEKAAAGEKAGTDAVMDGFKNGSVVTSVEDPTTGNKEDYTTYYGNAWDGRHP